MRLFICSLVVLVMLGSCQRSGVSGVEVDSKLKGFIPPKTQALIGFNVEKIKQSDFYKRHEAQLSFPQLNEFAQQIGLDPRRDLSSFLVAWNGVDTLAMSRGSFDSAQLAKRLRSANTASETYNKAALYGDGRTDLALLPKGIAIAGPAVLLKKALDQDATGGGGVPEDLLLQLARIDSGAQAWSVTSGVISLDKLAMRGDTAVNLSNISDYIGATAVGLTLASGLALDAHVTCISEEGSQRVHDALRGVIGLARLSTPDAQLGQLKLWDSIHVTKQGKEVHITSQLSPELADKLLTLISSTGRRF